MAFDEAPYLTCECEVVSPPTAIVRVTGELDAGTVPVLDRVVDAVLVQPGIDRVELDSTGLRFMDLRGLSAVLAIDRRLRSHGGRLEVLYPSHQVRRLLDITDSEHLIEEGLPA